MANIVLLIFLLTFCGRAASKGVSMYDEQYERSLQRLIELVSTPQVLTRGQYKVTRFAQVHLNYTNGFTWKNCGSRSDPIYIEQLSLSPDPISIPGDIEVEGKGKIQAQLTDPIDVDLIIKKKIAFFWVEVPCIDHLGSCSYGDICPKLESVTCPPELKQYNITCRCPFKKASYLVPQTKITIPKVPLPSFLTEGDYEVTANVKSGAKRLGCYQFDFSLS